MSITKNGKKIAVIGAARGLGLSIVREINHSSKEYSLFLSSRNSLKLKESLAQIEVEDAITFECDIADETQRQALFQALEVFAPEEIIYCPGGGPWGNFTARNWHDHLWAFQVTFLAAAELLYFAEKNILDCRKVLFIGSQIAESRPDPGAASYSAAKHALLGLCKSIWAEDGRIELGLYSPGYIDTGLLPANAWPRQKEGLVARPSDVARDLLKWFESHNKLGHKLYEKAVGN